MAEEIKWMSVLKNTGIVILGTIVGKISGSAIGRLSGIAGIGVTGLGFVLLDKMDDSKWIGYFTIGTGAGMIASPVMEVAPSSVKGLEGFGAFAEDFKEGVKSSTRNLATKFFLDKTPLAKYLPDTMSGLGNPENVSEEQAQKIIDEMIEDNRQKQLNGSDDDDDISGLVEDYNLNGDLSDDYAIAGPEDEEEMGRIKWGKFKMLAPHNQIKALNKMRHNKKLKLKRGKGAMRLLPPTIGDLSDLDDVFAGNDLVSDYM